MGNLTAMDTQAVRVTMEVLKEARVGAMVTNLIRVQGEPSMGQSIRRALHIKLTPAPGIHLKEARAAWPIRPVLVEGTPMKPERTVSREVAELVQPVHLLLPAASVGTGTETKGRNTVRSNYMQFARGLARTASTPGKT